ncbi:MAG: hypothetical protein OEQ39_24765, partial [Gammaproteobacteria bacterium]|nr:hypothetical protein [Gammaproteobacteria bacterium]
SAEEAEKRFKEIRKFAASTPLQLEDLVKAEILLKAVGAASEENLKQVAEVATVMGRSVEDVALAVGSLEAETLKRLGIELKKTGDKFEFNFRDKAGKALKVVANGAEEARESLTEVFGQKFGGGLEKSSATIAGKWSTFKDAVKEAFATIGARLLPTASRVLTQATDALNSLIGSGRLEAMGDAIARAADNLIDWLGDVNPTFDSVKEKLQEAGASIGKAIVDGALAAGKGVLSRLFGPLFQEVPGAAAARLENFKVPQVSQSVLDRFNASGAINLVPPDFGNAAIASANSARAQDRLGSSMNNPNFTYVVNGNDIGGLP